MLRLYDSGTVMDIQKWHWHDTFNSISGFIGITPISGPESKLHPTTLLATWSPPICDNCSLSFKAKKSLKYADLLLCVAPFDLDLSEAFYQN